MSHLGLQDVVVIIPAFNEEGSVGTVVKSAFEMNVREVVVVDDTSSDNTVIEAVASGATVLALSERLGAWGATQAGFRYATKIGAEIVITMDADGQHQAEDLPKLVNSIVNSTANVTIGCCISRGSALRRFAWQCIKAAAHIEISDITSGFRAYDSTAVRCLAAWPGTLISYQDVGVLLLLHRYKLKITEIEVAMSDRKDGRSRIFSSWSAVAFYMAQTLLLGVSKRSRSRLSSRAIDGDL